MMKIIFATILIACATAASAQTPVTGRVIYPRAQALADGVVRTNPDLLEVILHVSPTDTSPNIVIAAHLTKAIGEASGDDATVRFLDAANGRELEAVMNLWRVQRPVSS